MLLASLAVHVAAARRETEQSDKSKQRWLPRKAFSAVTSSSSFNVKNAIQSFYKYSSCSASATIFSIS